MSTYEVKECAKWHYGGPPKVSIDLPEFADGREISNLLVAADVGFGHVFRQVLPLLLHHCPYRVLVLERLSEFSWDSITVVVVSVGLDFLGVVLN